MFVYPLSLKEKKFFFNLKMPLPDMLSSGIACIPFPPAISHKMLNLVGDKTRNLMLTVHYTFTI